MMPELRSTIFTWRLKNSTSLHLGEGLVGAWGVAHEALDHAALEQVLLHDLVHVLDLDVLVEDAVGVDEGHRAHRARAEAAGLDDRDFPGEALVLQLLGEGGAHRESAGGDAAAACADQNMVLDFVHIWFLRSLIHIDGYDA